MSETLRYIFFVFCVAIRGIKAQPYSYFHPAMREKTAKLFFGLWPGSLFGRLLLILFGGLVLAQLISTAVFWLDREAFAFRGSAARAAQRVTDLIQTLEQLPPAQREHLARTLARPGYSFGFVLPAAIPSPSQSNRELTAMLNQRLRAQSSTRAPTAYVTRNSAASSPDTYEALVTAYLRDGTPLAVKLSLSSRPRNFLSGMLTRLAGLLLPMLVLIVLAVRWVTRPLTTLANAADELGRNIAAAPLAEHGPLEVRRAARAFNTMQERLLRYVRTREQVLAAMSHDLKTPVTRMRLRTELLDESPLKHEFAHDLDEMQDMVQATLNVMRGLDSEEKVQPVDLRALIESLVYDYEAKGVEIELVSCIQGPFPAKPLALKRCLQNLIGNAVQFATHVRIRVDDAHHEVRIAIIDDGPGIPEQELARVFDPYYRVEQSRNRDSGGHGLGLTIAYNLAQLHGGSITLRNRREGGLEALLVLPR